MGVGPILALSFNINEVKSVANEAVDKFAARGFRSLGVAQTDKDGKWQFIGVLKLLAYAKVPGLTPLLFNARVNARCTK